MVATRVLVKLRVATWANFGDAPDEQLGCGFFFFTPLSALLCFSFLRLLFKADARLIRGAALVFMPRDFAREAGPLLAGLAVVDGTVLSSNVNLAGGAGWRETGGEVTLACHCESDGAPFISGLEG